MYRGFYPKYNYRQHSNIESMLAKELVKEDPNIPNKSIFIDDYINLIAKKLHIKNKIPVLMEANLNRFPFKSKLKAGYTEISKKEWSEGFGEKNIKAISYGHMDHVFEDSVYTIYCFAWGTDHALVFGDTKEGCIKLLKSFFHKKDKELDPGCYKAVHGSRGFTYTRFELEDQTYVDLQSNVVRSIKLDFEQFFAKKQIYKELNVPHRRGLILTGPPGTGKTSLLRVLAKEALNGEVLILICNANDFSQMSISEFREVKGSKPTIVILEDLDDIDEDNRSDLLNNIDGIDSPEEVLYLGTTNYPEKVDKALKDRPSRFDRTYEIKEPNDSERVLFLREFGKIAQEHAESLAKITSGMSLAHLKEVVISSKLYDILLEEAVEALIKNRGKFIKNIGIR